jgi:hypothetical protein
MRCFCPPDSFRGFPGGQLARQLHKIEKLRHPTIQRRAGQAVVEGQRAAEHLAHGGCRVQGGVSHLEDGTVETLGVRQPRSGWKRVVSDPDQA